MSDSRRMRSLERSISIRLVSWQDACYVDAMVGSIEFKSHPKSADSETPLSSAVRQLLYAAGVRISNKAFECTYDGLAITGRQCA